MTLRSALCKRARTKHTSVSRIKSRTSASCAARRRYLDVELIKFKRKHRAAHVNSKEKLRFTRLHSARLALAFHCRSPRQASERRSASVGVARTTCHQGVDPIKRYVIALNTLPPVTRARSGHFPWENLAPLSKYHCNGFTVLFQVRKADSRASHLISIALQMPYERNKM